MTILEKSIDLFFSILPTKQPDSELIKKAKIIAHRGSWNKKDRLENTMKAFNHARDIGAFGIELDIQITKDQNFVVSHDDSLLRVFNKNDNISRLNLSEIKANFPLIPSLEEVINKFKGKLHLFIEIKKKLDKENEIALAKLLESLEPIKDYSLISLKEGILKDIKSFNRRSLMLVAEQYNTSTFCKSARVNYYGGVLGHYLLLTNHRLKNLKENDILTGVGFINSKNNLLKNIKRNVDFIFTDEAEKIMKIINDIKK